MKWITLTWCFILLASLTVVAQSDVKKADSLLQGKQYFQLRALMESNAYTIGEEDKIYFKAHLDNFFNKPVSSDKKINQLLSDKAVPRDRKKQLLLIQADNAIKLYQYERAHRHLTEYLATFSKETEDKLLKEINNSSTIWKSVSKSKPQKKVIIKRDMSIPFEYDKAGLMTLNVTVRKEDKPLHFIFDTGANLSVVSRKYASQLKLNILNSEFKVKAITGIEVNASLALCKQLNLGGITFQNVLFIVLPDEELVFANGQYEINGIIGFPVIEQLGKFSVNKDHTITVSSPPRQAATPNFGLDGLIAVVSLHCNEKNIQLTFDTGAQQTTLHKSLSDRFPELTTSAQQSEKQFGGAGGYKSTAVVTIPHFELYSGKHKAALKNVPVKMETEDNLHDGNLGQDFIKSFNRVTLDFKNMILTLE